MSEFKDQIERRDQAITKLAIEISGMIQKRDDLTDSIRLAVALQNDEQDARKLTLKRWIVALVKGGPVTITELGQITGETGIAHYVEQIPRVTWDLRGNVTIDPVFL